ncbi:hypothetical protein HOG98_08145 [bacterium]|jgi:hypothetical protein|nr:hypothetical protein [bacterium]
MINKLISHPKISSDFHFETISDLPKPLQKISINISKTLTAFEVLLNASFKEIKLSPNWKEETTFNPETNCLDIVKSLQSNVSQQPNNRFFFDIEQLTNLLSKILKNLYVDQKFSLLPLKEKKEALETVNSYSFSDLIGIVKLNLLPSSTTSIKHDLMTNYVELTTIKNKIRDDTQNLSDIETLISSTLDLATILILEATGQMFAEEILEAVLIDDESWKLQSGRYTNEFLIENVISEK